MKLRQLGKWAVIVAIALPAWVGSAWVECAQAAERPGAISGYVRDAEGAPQMGAVVEIIGTAARTLTVFTDGAGFYSAKDLLPGFYTIKVSAASFLPAWRDKVGLHPGTSTHLNITLSTLLNAMRVGPARDAADDDDWKWTLRSVANRPVLRALDDPAADSDSDKNVRDLKASLAFLAGSVSNGYGSGSDMSTHFSMERSVFSVDRMSISGNLGCDGNASGVVRASYSHLLLDGSTPTVAVSIRRLEPSDPNLHNASLQAGTFSASDRITLGDVLEVKFGSELQTIQFLGRASTFRPHAQINAHLSPNTVVSYAYATARPGSAYEKNLDPAVEDLDGDSNQSDPRISVNNFSTRLERDQHQEVSLSHRAGQTNLQLAVFSDRVGNTALLGTGEVTAAGGYLLPDAYSGMFTEAAGTLTTQGMRMVLARKLNSDLTATLDYAYGGVLDLARPDAPLQNVQQLVSTQRRQALAAKLAGTIPRTHTNWIASYRWANGQALTPVDMFNASPGQTDGFLNLFVRQPIPTLGFLPAHMDILVDLHNLLAQGYVPVMGQDGQTVYLVQAARSVQGGVSISF